MKVLMYGWEFPPHISGGLGVACHAIVTELAKKKTNITLILPYTQKDESSDFLTIIGCNHLNRELFSEFKKLCRETDIDIGWINPYMSDSSSCIRWNDLCDLRRYHNFLKRIHATHLSGEYGSNLLSEVFRYAILAGYLSRKLPHDIIHCHDWLTILAGVEARHYSGKPLIFHIHALETDRSGLYLNQSVFNIEKYGMQQADMIVTVSEYTRQQIIQNYSIDANKIKVAHNGVYPASGSCSPLFNDGPTPKVILFVGRITHQKGPYFFIEIAKKILAKRQDVQFVMVGQGDLLPEMIKRVAAARLGSYIHFTGFLSPEETKKVYQLADVFVMPSVSEPFGLTCLEALSYDVPVVISKQSGVSETLRHTLKSDFWDVDDMANKIVALLDRPRLRNTLLQQAKKDLKRITWCNTANQILSVYSQWVR